LVIFFGFFFKLKTRFYANGQFTHSSPFLPYTFNSKQNNPAAYNFETGSYQIFATPYQINNNGNITGTGPSGNNLTVSFSVVQNSLTTIIGPPILVTAPAGSSYLQMQGTGTSFNILINSMDILFSPNSNPIGIYEVRIYQSDNNLFSLVSKQEINVTAQSILFLPAHIVMNPPIPVLTGQFIALSSKNVLPLPDISVGSSSPLYTLTTAPNDTAPINPVLNGTGSAWRISYQLYTPPSNNVPTSIPIVAIASAVVSSGNGNPGALIGVIVGVVGGVLLIAAIIIFVVWRVRRASEDLMPAQYSAPTLMASSRSFVSASNLVSKPTDGRPTTTVVPREAVDTKISTYSKDRKRPATFRTTEHIICSRCPYDQEKEATVACEECKNYFCDNCNTQLHFSTGNLWGNHNIRPVKIVPSGAKGISSKPVLYCPQCGTARLDSAICPSCKFDFSVLPKQIP